MDVSELREQPWRSYAAPQKVNLPKGMLGAPERTCFYWLGKYWLSGAGCVVDAGAFIGASAFCFASGAIDGGHQSFSGKPLVHSYDYFQVIDEYVGEFISRHFRPISPGESYLDIFQAQTYSCRDAIQTYSGDFLNQQWSGDPIEVLFIDVAKTDKLGQHCCAEFFPSLMPQRSIVIHQDYYHCWHPFIHISMEFLSDEFELLDERVPYQSRVWLLSNPIPLEKIARVGRYDFTASEKLGLLDRLIEKSSSKNRPMMEVVRVWQLCLDHDFATARARIADMHRQYDVDNIKDLWVEQLRQIESVSLTQMELRAEGQSQL